MMLVRVEKGVKALKLARKDLNQSLRAENGIPRSARRYAWALRGCRKTLEKMVREWAS